MFNYNKYLIIFTCSIMLNFNPAPAQENSGERNKLIGTTLSLSDCMDLAIENNPDLKSSFFNTHIFKSKIAQAKSVYFPQINVFTGFNRNNPSVESDLFDYSNNEFSTGINLNQLIYDFGKTSANISINRFNFLATTEDLKDKLREILYQVKKVYYQVLLKTQNKEVFAESVERYEKQLEQAQELYKKGFKSKIDVISAEVNLSNSKLLLVKAENELLIAYANLNNIMGLSTLNDYTLSGDLEFIDFVINFEEALNTAYEYRPDLKSIGFAKSSAEKSISYAKRQYFPELTGETAFGARGNFPIDPSWSVGANIVVPVFNGLLTHNKIKEAKATVLKKESDSEALRQKIYLEIKQIYFDFEERKKELPLAKEIIEQAQEKYNLAEKRYKIGVGNFIELKDAELELRNSELSYLNILYEYNVSLFDLEKAVGKDIPDIPGIY